jgi:hypothetical protein
VSHLVASLPETSKLDLCDTQLRTLDTAFLEFLSEGEAMGTHIPWQESALGATGQKEVLVAKKQNRKVTASFVKKRPSSRLLGVCSGSGDIAVL